MCLYVEHVYLSAAVRRNRMTNDATDADIQRQVVRFMHGAQDRDGGHRDDRNAPMEDLQSSTLTTCLTILNRVIAAVGVAVTLQ